MPCPDNVVLHPMENRCRCLGAKSHQRGRVGNMSKFCRFEQSLLNVPYNNVVLHPIEKCCRCVGAKPLREAKNRVSSWISCRGTAFKELCA
ncbi:hypothetical protein [Microseira wollei]|uniref:hypothetical protein n=1 Tax=Microseira wollei TaxID=467598 RepID=UPI001CFD4405|nr:hypothetical protein [Microseira wollei]